MRISIILLISMMVLVLYSCSAAGGGGGDDKRHNAGDTVTITPLAMLDGIPTPESYGITAGFNDITYSRPDTERLISLIEQAQGLAESELSSYDELVSAISEADAEYENFITMLTYLSIKTSADLTDSYYTAEYSELSEATSEISDAVEELLVSAARSEHAEKLEKNLFGEGFIEQYSSERLTDRAVELLREETRLENEYRMLSPATVLIEYGGVRESYQAIAERLMSQGNTSELELQKQLAACTLLYQRERLTSARGIYVELLKVRRLIADELGYESYTEYAYETIYHDYTPEDMESLCDSVAKYIVPVMSTLDDKVFYNYFTKNKASSLSSGTLHSALGGLYRGIDRELAGIYGFMEHYSLIDVAEESEERDSGAYTTYIDAINSPFIFMSSSGSITDFAVLSHEFGHFYDSFINGGERASLDLLELSSQSLELLTLDMLKLTLDESSFKYLYYYEMRSALTTLIYQSFYSAFEHAAYSLSYSEISDERLCELVSQQAARMNLSRSYFNDLSYILTDQTVMYPHYSQSYAVSLIPSLEIYFTECESDGAGLAIYKNVIARDGDTDLFMQLKSAQLSSPFDSKVIKSIANEIHFSILGYHYYKEFDYGQNAA